MSWLFNRTENSQSCLAKADSAAQKCGLRYATQLAIDDLWKQFNKAPASATGELFHKGDALLQHMYTNEATSGGTKHKVLWALPSAPHEQICKCCWARCAGFYDFTQNNVNSTFRATLSMFNKRLSTAKRETLQAGTDGSHARLASGNNSGKKALAVQAFLKTWMAESTDLIPDSDDEEDDMRYDSDAPDTHTNIAGSRQRVHVDVNFKKDIYEACIDDIRDEMASAGKTYTEKEYDQPISPDYFLKILRQHYKVIMHKYKSHSQCRQCLHYRESLRTKISPVDKIKLKKCRAAHYAIVYPCKVCSPEAI